MLLDSITLQWIERADYDFETARSLLKSGRYLYVAFMCQQCTEKYLKAFISSTGEMPPFIHNLARLAEISGLLKDLPKELQMFLANLNPYYIKARYGEYKESLSKVCNEQQARLFLDKTEEMIKWLKQKMR